MRELIRIICNINLLVTKECKYMHLSLNRYHINFILEIYTGGQKFEILTLISLSLKIKQKNIKTYV